jgi:hypothetical protein
MKNTIIQTKFASNYFISAIEGTVLSHYYSILFRIKTKKWINKISLRYFNCELILFQLFLIGNLVVTYNNVTRFILFFSFNLEY